jgi:hypothetical protein
MHTAQLMQRAMAAHGRHAHGIVSTDLNRFAALGLTGSERLSAVAGAVAAVAAKRHAGAPARFLQQLQELTRPSSGAAAFADHEAHAMQRPSEIAAAIAALDTGFERLAAELAAAGVAADHAAAIEAVLLSRLLVGHRPHRIRLALLACAVALAEPSYRAGDLVPFLPEERPAAPASPAAAEPPRTGTLG